MTPAPPPPRPLPSDAAETEDNVGNDSAVFIARLQTLREERKTRLAAHKQTAMRATKHVEDILAETPVDPLKLPTPAQLHESDESGSDVGPSVQSAVLDPSESRENCDPIADGFAALRAQRAQRKQRIREAKKTSEGVRRVQQRTSTSQYHRLTPEERRQIEQGRAQEGR